LIVQGRKSAGKPRFTEAMVYHIELGTDFMGFKVERKARILYLDGEMPPQRIEERLRNLVLPRGKRKKDLPGTGAA
jgi:hypothetical protein